MLQLSLCLLGSVAQGQDATTNTYSVRIGVLAKRGSRHCLRQWSPTARYLESRLPGLSVEVVPLDFAEILPAAQRAECEFFLVNSAMYMCLATKVGAERIVTLENLREGYTCRRFGGVIFTRATRTDITSLEDLQSCSFAAVAQDSLGGWLACRYEMYGRGLKPETHFSHLDFLGTHDAVVYAVREGVFDAGTVRTDTLERMAREGRIRLEDLKIIHLQPRDEQFPFARSTALYPEWPMAVLPHVDRDVADRVAVALLQMSPDSEAARAAKCSGWTVPLSYTPVRNLLRDLKIDPFDEVTNITLKEAFLQHVLVYLSVLLATTLTLLVAIYMIRLNVKLRAANRKAMSAVVAKTSFMASMSHEIRTPLHGIIGMTGLLEQTSLDDEQKDYVRTVCNSSESLLAILNDVLDFSKIETDNLVLESHPFELRPLIENVMFLFSQAATGKNLEVLCEIHPQVPAMLKGDSTRLRQVLGNLVGNAVKFTDRGEIHLKVDEPQRFGDRCQLTISVRDTGIGIPEEQYASIFESFSQGDVSTTRKYGGTGLGLAICYRLVQAMGGELSVQSRMGEGSVFTFNISLETVGAFPEPDSLRSDVLAGLRILVVDDNATNRRIVCEYCARWGMQVDACTSGREAYERLEARRAYNVALVDNLMPDLDGIQTILRIRKLVTEVELPIVLMSNTGRPGDLPENMIQGYISKPVRRHQLQNILTRLIEQPKALEADVPAAQPHRLPSEMRAMKILLVEDHPVNQKLVVITLKKMGYMPDTVGNGVLALEAVAKEHYDLILMDIQMPEMNGLEATQKIRALDLPYRPQIVAMTAAALPKNREECLNAGMDDYLVKPLMTAQLEQAVEDAWIRIQAEAEDVD